MTWDLVESRVDLHGYLNVSPPNPLCRCTYCMARSSLQTSPTGCTPRTPTASSSSRCASPRRWEASPADPAPQSQASWFVITGNDFVVDAHNTGGIIGNGQYWWSWYGNGTRIDGDGRPVALTVWRALRGTIANFRIEGQPFWCNAVAESQDVVYDGMYCNATNADPLYYNQK